MASDVDRTALHTGNPRGGAQLLETLEFAVTCARAVARRRRRSPALKRRGEDGILPGYRRLEGEVRDAQRSCCFPRDHLRSLRRSSGFHN